MMIQKGIQRRPKKPEIFEFYFQAPGDLPGIAFMPEAGFGRCSRWQTVILVTRESFGTDREAIRLAFEAENIESRPLWKPMHRQTVFDVGDSQQPFSANKRYATRVVGGRISEDLFARGLCLPSGTALQERDLERVVSIVRRCGRLV